MNYVSMEKRDPSFAGISFFIDNQLCRDVIKQTRLSLDQSLTNLG